MWLLSLVLGLGFVSSAQVNHTIDDASPLVTYRAVIDRSLTGFNRSQLNNGTVTFIPATAHDSPTISMNFTGTLRRQNYGDIYSLIHSRRYGHLRLRRLSRRPQRVVRFGILRANRRCPVRRMGCRPDGAAGEPSGVPQHHNAERPAQLCNTGPAGMGAVLRLCGVYVRVVLFLYF